MEDYLFEAASELFIFFLLALPVALLVFSIISASKFFQLKKELKTDANLKKRTVIFGIASALSIAILLFLVISFMVSIAYM